MVSCVCANANFLSILELDGYSCSETFVPGGHTVMSPCNACFVCYYPRVGYNRYVFWHVLLIEAYPAGGTSWKPPHEGQGPEQHATSSDPGSERLPAVLECEGLRLPPAVLPSTSHLPANASTCLGLTRPQSLQSFIQTHVHTSLAWAGMIAKKCMVVLHRHATVN